MKENNLESEVGEEGQPTTVPVDWLLQHLVWMANTHDMVIPITLNVRGLIVSGELVGGVEYFGEIGKDFASGLQGYRGADTVTGIFKEWSGRIYRDSKDTPRKDLREPHFIHLRNVKFYSPGQRPLPKNPGVWWRGRLAGVDGFCLGSLTGAPE